MLTAAKSMALALNHVPHPCKGDPCLMCGARAWAAIHDPDFAEQHGVFLPPRAPKPPKPMQHGTSTAYTYRKCRCDECRAWMRNYARERRERQRVEKSSLPEITRSYLKAKAGLKVRRFIESEQP